MTEQRIPIKADFRIKTMQTLVFRDNQRVNFEHRHVFGKEAFIEDFTKLARLFREVAFQVQRFGERPAVMRHKTRRRINVEIDDFLGRVMRDGFDVHPAFC